MTKEELRQYRSIQLEICQLQRRIEAMEGRTDDIGLNETLQALYREKLQSLLDCLVRIEKAIETLTPIERELIRLRYIDGADWTEVAATIHYEWSQTHRIHARALTKMKNL